jgi:hypothetical protein
MLQIINLVKYVIPYLKICETFRYNIMIKYFAVLD